MTKQIKIAKKRELEMLLEKTRSYPKPNIILEQYTLPADLAGWILRCAAYSHDDVQGRRIIDLGCGTGRLAIGAALLDANSVVGVDVDPVAVKIARENAENVGVKNRVSWIISEIDSVKGYYDTVLQNPPFGVHHRGADMKFLKKAMDVADVVYSLHKSERENRKFISNFVKKFGREIKVIMQTEFEIPPIFEFHRRRKHTVTVDLYRVK
jgi:putative methylase